MIQNGKPRRIPIATLDDLVLVEDSLEAEPETQRRPPRGLVQRITLPF